MTDITEKWTKLVNEFLESGKANEHGVRKEGLREEH